MLINRVQAEFIGTNRIDPDYYRPEYLADEKLLRGFGSDELSSVGRFFAGPFGSKLPSEFYLSSGIPLFRVGNVGSMEVLMDGMAHLAPDIHADLIDSEVVSGDLLIVKASVGQKICRVPQWMPRANITQHIIGIRPNGEVDMDYVAAFLVCEFGRRQLVRRSLGSIIQYLGVTDSKTVLLPRVTSELQEMIGGKVRQAEWLRDYGKFLDSSIRNLIETDKLRDALASQNPKSQNAPVKFIQDRLDSKYYTVRALAVHHACSLEGEKEIADLSPRMSNGFEYRDFVSEGRPFITVSEVSAGRLDTNFAPRIPWTVEIPEKASVNECCVLVVRSGTVGCAVKAHREDSSAALASDIIRLEFSEEKTAAAIAAFLSSPTGSFLLTRASYGTVMPKLAQEELIRIPVPNHVLNHSDELLRLTNAREDSFRNANRLSLAAKLLIEALIDGKISEAELVATQEALERGDHSADRALLSRLSRKGLDVSSEPPLFPDLDALYSLLQETKTTNRNENEHPESPYFEGNFG